MLRPKIIVAIIVALLIIAVAGWATGFYYRFLRGIGPVIKKPPEDIVKLEEEKKLPLKFLASDLKIFAKNLNKPRVLAFDPAGNLTVSEMGAGKVVSFRDNNNDGVADDTAMVANELNKPHGLAFYCPDYEEGMNGSCRLYIAETDKVAVYDYDPVARRAINKKKIIDLPSGGNHTTRTILIHNDKLYISIGSSCNVCSEKDVRRAKIFSANLDGSDFKEFARGLRNAVFMAINPRDGKIWATEMGRDFLGDDLPPDEINIIKEGRWYGWPWFYGKNIEDYDFSPRSRPSFAAEPEPSYIDIPAHSAPLGLAFFPEEGWPEEYWYNLLVAYHGSWNRSVPTGYKIVRYKLDEKGNYLGEEDFITGWLTDKGALGRPVDIIFSPGGTMHVSDDKAGVIYRIDVGSDIK